MSLPGVDHEQSCSDAEAGNVKSVNVALINFCYFPCLYQLVFFDLFCFVFVTWLTVFMLLFLQMNKKHSDVFDKT